MSGHIDVFNPYTEQKIAQVPKCTLDDVDQATAAAHAALTFWSKLPVEERISYLEKICDGLDARKNEIAEIITKEVGTPVNIAKKIQAALPVAVARSYCDLGRDYPFEYSVGNSTILKQAVGVVACITPWNYPLHQIMAKIAPALLAGCTIVLKPSEVAPLNAFILTEIISASGLPDGVFNLVCGHGDDIGEYLVSHEAIDMVSFTGSVAVGKHIATICAQDVKRTSLELGGKSASIILDDANFPKAVKSTLNSCFLNSGQTCNALTRMLVPVQHYDEIARLAIELCQAYVMGDPSAQETKIGPVINAAQREIIHSMIASGINEGAKLLCGGLELPTALDNGFFVQPTIFGNVTADMAIAQKEIFGPVLSIICYATDEEAIAIANNSPYGLGGAVWSNDPQRAMRVAKEIKTGQVDINGAPFNLLAPFGGVKQSGYGRELGEFGLEEFLEPKSIQA